MISPTPTEHAQFPFDRKTRIGIIAALGIGVLCLAAGMSPSVAHGGAPDRSWILSGVALAGIALLLIGLATPGPSVRRHRETGLFIIPGKGGAIETRYAAVMWAFVAFFSGMGLTLTILSGVLLLDIHLSQQGQVQ